MITAQDKRLITEVLEKYGPEKILGVIKRSPVRGSWSNCFLAYVYGNPAELQNCMITEEVIKLVGTHTYPRVAHVMRLTAEQVAAVAESFDCYNWDFMELVEEWL